MGQTRIQNEEKIVWVLKEDVHIAQTGNERANKIEKEKIE